MTMPSRSCGSQALSKRISTPCAVSWSCKRWQHAARLDMAFVGEEQRIAETAGERGFEFADAVVVNALVMRGHACEALEVGTVARMGYALTNR